jgi:60 kDa SS-A/Ro ribonucleoprotein
MRLNTAPTPSKTFEGATAITGDAITQLRRTILSCMLFEDTFYEDGKTIYERIKDLVPKCDISDVGDLAVRARRDFKIRHASLLLLREMVRHPMHRSLDKRTWDHVFDTVIQRADELSEFVAMYWKDGKTPLSARVKKGLAVAFQKFDEYQL